MKTKALFCVLVLTAASVFAAPTNSATGWPAADPAAVARWQALRFGMFIHWGPVSLTGDEIGWSRGAQTPVEVYDNLYKQFNPTNFNADEWVSLAKSAGMKYIVLTTKHHDGFCLWDTKLTDYNIMHTPFHRDVVKELAVACQKQGIALGTYYSVTDWYNTNWPVTSPAGKVKREHSDLDAYEKYLQGQITELIQNNGPLITIWNDVPAMYGKRGAETIKLIRSLQPDILINNRTGDGGDYDTPEQKIGKFQMDRPWESCMTVSAHNHWAWGGEKDGVKPLAACLDMIIRAAGGDGNILLNVGPRPDGMIDPAQANLLKEIGVWLAKNGDSIYGTRGGPWEPTLAIASTRKGNMIYVHVLNWQGGPLQLPPLPMKVVSSRVLGGGHAEVKQSDAGVEISVPASDRQPMDTVIALQLDGDALNISAMIVPLTNSSGLFAPNVKRVVFLGDSITYAGQYVEDVAAYEHARFPDRKMEFINVGLPSETVSGLSEPGHAGGKFPRPDLHERLARVLDKTKPDLVFACYGMNDGIYEPFDETRFKLFQDGIEWLHTQVEKSGARIIHVTPPVFDEAKGGHKGYAEVLDRYSAWLIAQRTNGWDVVDLHFPMKQYLAAERETNTTFALTRDGIHPGDLGHWLMAQQILLYLGAKDAATTGSIDELISRYPNGEDILHQNQKDQAVWKDAWLTAIGHKRPGMKQGLPIEIDSVTGSAHFMTNSVSKNGGNL